MLVHALLTASFLSLTAPAGPVGPPDAGPGCAHAKTAARLWAGAPPRADGFSEDTDLLHYHLDIEIDPVTEWIGGSNTMTARSRVDGLAVFRFRLQDVFTITEVSMGGMGVGWTRLDDATIEVTLDRIYDADEVFEIHVAYDGFPSPPPGGFGSIEFRSRGGAREVWTLSEPWFAYTWWPCKDDNTDKTTADLWFTVPDPMVVASNGLLEGIDAVGGNRSRYRWKTEYPTADYLYCIGATNYETFGATWQFGLFTMPLSFYIYPEDNTQSHRDAWLRNLEMLDVFSGRYGIYPFVDEKYGMCQVGFGGGMEHQTMTSQGGFWESITAHELAHQWWGDEVTCATWHDIWLNEGFATFSEAVWYGERPGGTMADYHARMEQRRPSRVDDSVYVYDIGDVGRIFSSNFTYRKAAWVVHMLRHVVGDETFFDLLAAYREAYRFGAATTEDLRAVAETVYGHDLTWFFNQWVYDIGAPAYRHGWQQHDVNGRTYVELYMQQVQSGNYPVFAMPLDIVMSTAADDALVVVWNDEPAEHLLFEVDSDVLGLQVDPDEWVLATSNSTTPFVEGPPKIIAIDPPPGAVVAPGQVDEITVVFHKNALNGASDFELTGDVTGPVSFTHSYNPVTFTATLTLAAPLARDAYTLTIRDSIEDVSGGRPLDGEIVDDLLPSGEGLAGGDGIARFTAFMALPDSFNVVYGVHRAGTVDDLQFSDDARVDIEQRPALSVLLPLIRLEVTGHAGTAAAVELGVTLETSTTALPTQPPQRLSLYDFDGEAWEIVDVRQTTLEDSVVSVEIDTNASRFIELGLETLRLRVEWFDPGNVFVPAWITRTDQAVWTVVP